MPKLSKRKKAAQSAFQKRMRNSKTALFISSSSFRTFVSQKPPEKCPFIERNIKQCFECRFNIFSIFSQSSEKIIEIWDDDDDDDEISESSDSSQDEDLEFSDNLI